MKKWIGAMVGLVILGGCGGGDSAETPATVTPAVMPAEPPPEKQATNTADVTASDDFNFRTDRDVELSLGNEAPGQGIIHVYHGFEFHDEEAGIYYPNYGTRILSFNPQNTASVTIQLNRNWEALYVEFAPTEAELTEQYHKIDLDGQGNPVILLD